MRFIILDPDLNKCGAGLCNAHLWKNIVDIARILSTVLRGLEPIKEKSNPILYKSGSFETPIIQWICAHIDHYLYTCSLGLELCSEYTRRKDNSGTEGACLRRKHKSETLILYAWKNIPEKLKYQTKEFMLRDFPLEWKGNKSNRKITKSSSCLFEIVHYFRTEYINKVLPRVHIDVRWGPTGIPDWLITHWSDPAYQSYCKSIHETKKRKRKPKKKKKVKTTEPPVEIRIEEMVPFPEEYKEIEYFVEHEMKDLELSKFLEGMDLYLDVINVSFDL